MDKNTDNFWTDGLVKEFTLEAIKLQTSLPNDVNLNRGIYHFKKEKSKKEEPQWEILSFVNTTQNNLLLKRGDDGYFREKRHHGGNIESLLLSMPHMKIHSVKRLSGVHKSTFTIGDIDQFGKITGFYIEGDNMFVKHDNYGGTQYLTNCVLEEKKAPKEEQVPIKVKSFINSHFPHPVNGYTLFTTGEIPEEKYQSIKSAIEDVLNSETLESIKKKYEDKIKEIKRNSLLKIFDMNNNIRNQFP